MADRAAINNHAAFIWSVADQLRGDYAQSEYGNVILPLTVLRRLDSVLDPVKEAMLARYAEVKDNVQNVGPILDRLTDTRHLWNTSRFDLPKLLDDPDRLADNLRAYVAGFSPQVRDIITHFDLDAQITRLEEANLLYKVLDKFVELDLRPDVVSNLEMAFLYEELIRRFSELSSETAGEHFTARDVVHLVVTLLLGADHDRLVAAADRSVTVFDPVCGTGGMLAVASRHLHQINPSLSVELFGQELNRSTGAICMAELLMSGGEPAGIALGDSLSNDGHHGKTFDYLLANPPYGMNWRRQKDEVTAEHQNEGEGGRFGAGLPRINDASFLFLQHMISKMKRPEDGGSRLAIVFNGSPLFAGPAGSGEWEIRRWILENDWLEAIVALPDQLFYNTGISTYLWIVTNRKRPERRSQVQLIDARELFTKMRRSIGEKRKQISDSDVENVLREYTHAGNSSRNVPVEELLSNPGGAARIEPWMFDPSVSVSTHVRLSDLIEVVRPGPVTVAMPLLSVDALDSLSIAADDLEREAELGRRYSVCHGGDVVGNGRRWAVLPSEFGSAATALGVLRPFPGGQLDAHLLALWLSSEECAQQLAGSTGPRVRDDVMVPRRLRANQALAAAAQEVSEMRAAARRLLENMLEDPFRGDVDHGSPEARLLAQASAARAVRSLLQPLEDVVHRAEWQYPYQIAKSARDYRLAVTIDRRLEAGLLLAESLIRTIDLVAAAIHLAQEQSRKPEILAFFSGGISTGSWLRILRAAQNNSALEMYPELKSISFKKRGLGDALQSCVNVRNRQKHATGMLSTAERQEILDELDPLLIESLDQSAWLGLFENIWVTSCEYTSSGFVIHGLRVNGSHPDWEPLTEGVADPVVPNRLYLRTPRTGLLDLTPFAAIAACSMCKREELYVLDRVQSGAGQARSVRDHRIELKIAM